MRFASSLFLLASLAFGVSTVSAEPGQSPAPTSTLTKRLVQVNTCVNLALRINAPVATVTVPITGTTIQVNPTLDLGTTCLCADANGQLTDTTTAALRAQLLQGNNLNILGGSLLGLNAVPLTIDVAAALANAAALAQLDLLTPPAACTYPTGATAAEPTCEFRCAFTCPAGQIADQTARTCSLAPSARRKRAQLALERPGACAFGMQACSVIGISGRRTSKFECLDTKQNIESCGGCMFPLRNQPAGEDCTLIPMVESVSCNKGRCAVESCVRGFIVSESGDSCVAALRK